MVKVAMVALLTTDKLIPGKIMTVHTGSAYGLYSMMFFHTGKVRNRCYYKRCAVTYDDGFNPVLKAVENVLYEE
jgi:hypothetical protein